MDVEQCWDVDKYFKEVRDCMKRFEFSKLILCLVMLTYFVGLGFGIYIIAELASSTTTYISTALCGLFSYIGTPVAVAIGFYSYKAKAENVEKIRGMNIDIPKIPEDRYDEEEV